MGGVMELVDARGTVHTLGTRTRRYFSYVPQGNLLFSGTLRENLLGVKPDATEEEIIEACKKKKANKLENIPGIETSECEVSDKIKVNTVRIIDEQGEQAIGKPIRNVCNS